MIGFRTIAIPLALALAGLVHGAEGGAAPANDADVDAEVASQDSRKLLEDVLMARLTRELALDETQTVLLMRHLAEFRDRMIALRRERAEKLRELRQAVRESKDENRIAVLLEELIALNQKNATARDDIINFDGFELTTWQKARLLLFLNDFESDMKRLLRRAQERRAAGPKESSGATPGGRGGRQGTRADERLNGETGSRYEGGTPIEVAP